jgi:hypothetical protein
VLGKKIRAIIAANISATLIMTTSSGRTFMPCVSSSKKRSNPALAAGIGPRLSRFLLLLWLIYLTSANQTALLDETN